MSNIKTTDWFDGAKFVPCHVGVYESSCGYYRYWNGVKWGGHGVIPDRAIKFMDLHDFDQSPTWRGIKK